jgi:hypothetical protein
VGESNLEDQEYRISEDLAAGEGSYLLAEDRPEALGA